jgi:hypothetical protein
MATAPLPKLVRKRVSAFPVGPYSKARAYLFHHGIYLTIPESTQPSGRHSPRKSSGSSGMSARLDVYCSVMAYAPPESFILIKSALTQGVTPTKPRQ